MINEITHKKFYDNDLNTCFVESISRNDFDYCARRLWKVLMPIYRKGKLFLCNIFQGIEESLRGFIRIVD